MNRIFFMGIHNKPCLTPLHSSTRSGKLIDRIITRISGFEVIKTNLYECEYMPPLDRLAGNKWSARVCYNRETDIVFALGAVTHQHLRGSWVKFIPIGHPSGVWSHKAQDEYVEKTLERIEHLTGKELTL